MLIRDIRLIMQPFFFLFITMLFYFILLPFAFRHGILKKGVVAFLNNWLRTRLFFYDAGFHLCNTSGGRLIKDHQMEPYHRRGRQQNEPALFFFRLNLCVITSPQMFSSIIKLKKNMKLTKFIQCALILMPFLYHNMHPQTYILFHLQCVELQQRNIGTLSTTSVLRQVSIVLLSIQLKHYWPNLFHCLSYIRKHVVFVSEHASSFSKECG